MGMKEEEERTALDMWVKFYTDAENSDTEEGVEFEANTFELPSGYVVEWYHVGFGQVMGCRFDTYEAAQLWLEKQGFVDLTPLI